MSARFGRNQRRKLRQEVAARDREVARLESVAGSHHDKMLRERDRRAAVEREMVNWASRILTLMGPESPFNRNLGRHNVDTLMFKQVAFQGRPYRLHPTGSLDHMGPTRAGEMCEVSATVIQAFAVAPERYLEIAREAVGFYIHDGAHQTSKALVFDLRTLHNLKGAGDPWLADQLLQGLIEPWNSGEG